MASGELRFSSTAMHDLWTDLNAVKNEFDHADAHSGTAADAVGHSGLADRIRSFSSKWDSHRDELSESMSKLAKIALSINDGFDKSETELVKSIAGDGS